MLSTTVCCLLGLIYFGRYVSFTYPQISPLPFSSFIQSLSYSNLCPLYNSTAAFNSFTGVATICLSTSYGAPILVSLLRGRKLVQNSPYSLGKFGYVINIITILWICLSVALFCMPVAIPVTKESMSPPPLLRYICTCSLLISPAFRLRIGSLHRIHNYLSGMVLYPWKEAFRGT